MGYSTSGVSLSFDALNPEVWIRSVWNDFVDLWPKILGLEHAAATISATSTGVTHDAAEALVQSAASLSSIQSRTQAKVETLLADLGVGAIVAAAVTVTLAACATIMVYCFVKYAALSSTLGAIQAGTIQASDVPAIANAGGPLPDLSVIGTAGKGILLGAIGIIGLVLFLRHRRRNPHLVLFGANPQPPGTWSSRVLSMDYIHGDDGQAYRHEFKRGVSLQALEDGSVRLYGDHGQRLWEDF